MIGNQMMDYYVRPWHIYSHSRTCTHSGSCRRPSNLVTFHVCYLLYRVSVHEISALVIWFQCISNIFIRYGDIDPLYIFSYYGDIDLLHILIHFGDFDLLYIVRGDDHTCHILYIILFMAIVSLCIQDCYMYLQSYENIDYCIVLMSGLFFHLGLH